MLGTVRQHDTTSRRTWSARLLTLRGYLVVAVALLAAKIVQPAFGQ